jgi:membrane associated rhomboid family serine protease
LFELHRVDAPIMTVNVASLSPDCAEPGRGGYAMDAAGPSSADRERAEDAERTDRGNDRTWDTEVLPWATIALAVVILIWFIAVGFADCSLIRAGALVRPLVLQGHEWYRLVTVGLLHGSWSHWFFNTIALLLAGWTLEPLIGAAWLLALFIASVVGGALFSLGFGGDYGLSVGASGGILGLFAAKLFLAYGHFSAGAQRNRLAVSSIRVVIASLVPQATDDGASIDVAAHWGGAMAGAALAFALTLQWAGDDETPPGRQGIAWAVVAGATGMVIWGMIAAFRSAACS